MSRQQTGSETVQGRHRAREKVLALRQKEDLLAVMSTPQGRRYVWRVIEGVAGAFSSSFTGGNETFFREGKRHVGLELVAECQRDCPTLYMQMINEQVSARAEEEAVREAFNKPTETDE